MENHDWIVAFACFLINLVILGTGRVASVYYVESMTRYNASRQDASFPFVLSHLMRTASGPVIGFFGRKYGLKETTIFGCFLSATGVAACYLAEDILAIKIFWGLLFGLGFGFSTVLLPIILTNLYKKHQTKANGFALAGACVGGVILPPIVQYFIEHYGTSGSFLLLAGIVLHSMPAAMILKNPKLGQQTSQDVYDDQKIISSTKNCFTAPNEDTKLTDFMQRNKELISSCCVSALGKSGGIKECQCNKRCEIARGDTTIVSENILPAEKVSNEENLNYISTENFKKDTNCSNDRFKIKTFCDFHLIKKSKALLKAFSVLANPVFIVISVVQSSYAFISVTFLTIMVDFVRDKNIPIGTEAYFIMCLSIFDFVGHVSLGFVTDGRYITRTNYFVLCYFIMGMSFVILVLSTTFVLLMIGVSLFGLMAGAVFVVFPGIIHEFIEINHQTIAMSSGCILYAPLCFATSPLIGNILLLNKYKIVIK